MWPAGGCLDSPRVNASGRTSDHAPTHRACHGRPLRCRVRCRVRQLADGRRIVRGMPPPHGLVTHLTTPLFF